MQIQKCGPLAILGFLGAVAAFSCNARELYSGRDPIGFQFMEQIPQASTMGGYPLLSLGNDPNLIHLKTSYSTGTASALALGNLSFVDVRGGKFFAAIDMQANLETGNMSDWTDEPCKRDDFLWKRSTGGAFRNINCATISDRCPRREGRNRNKCCRIPVFLACNLRDLCECE